MGATANYPLVIRQLVGLKSHFHLIHNKKYMEVINELSQYEILSDGDNDHLPNHVQLAEKLKYNQVKMNGILKELFNKIIENLYDHPLSIKDVIYILHISPYIEPEDQKNNKEWVKNEWGKATLVSAILPIIPRIGDHIELPFMRMHYGHSSEDKYYSGYVHEVKHSFKGSTHEISIFIYPFRSFYYKWEEMRKEYEDHKRWVERLRHENAH
jgi:hypothetical protein